MHQLHAPLAVSLRWTQPLNEKHLANSDLHVNFQQDIYIVMTHTAEG